VAYQNRESEFKGGRPAELRLLTLQKNLGGSLYIVADRGEVVISITGPRRADAERFDQIARDRTCGEVA
jgi:hypothetical protein